MNRLRDARGIDTAASIGRGCGSDAQLQQVQRGASVAVGVYGDGVERVGLDVDRFAAQAAIRIG